jgi:HPt (histidine-containing phosphotransfer) domain-containing protein
MTKSSLVTPDMKLRYLHRRLEELALSTDKLNSYDFDFFKNMGHQIKGNAVTFEFPSLTALGVSLEEFAEDKKRDQVEQVVGELKLAVQGLLDRFENEKPDI